MAGEPPFYVEIDGIWHEVAYNETVCGEAIPFGAELQYDVPAKVHCGANKTKAKAAPAGRAKAKK